MPCTHESDVVRIDVRWAAAMGLVVALILDAILYAAADRRDDVLGRTRIIADRLTRDETKTLARYYAGLPLPGTVSGGGED